MEAPPPVSPQTQTWAAIIAATVGALGAVFAKKRFPRPKSATQKSITVAEFHQSLETLRDKLDTNQKEVLAAITEHSNTIEKRLDALESAVARLDERTKKLA